MSWERAFVVATVTLGGSYEDALASMDDGARAKIAQPVAAVRAKSKVERAAWMAAVLQEVVVELDRMVLR